MAAMVRSADSCLLDGPPPGSLYVYPKLRRRGEIRLLQTTHNKTSKKLTGRLEASILGSDSVPAYSAISYAWGNKQPVDRIWLSVDQFLPLTASASYILRRVEHGWIWIDSVCINQADDSEKSHQVPLMAQIYKGAEMVSAWLGDLRQNADLALEFLEKDLYVKEIDPGGSSRQAREFKRRRMDPVPLANDHEGVQWRAVSDLLRRPYFTRCWIVQEMASNRKLEFTCGGKRSLSWSSLQSAHGVIQRFRSLQEQLISSEYSRTSESTDETPSTLPHRAQAAYDQVQSEIGVVTHWLEPHWTQDLHERIVRGLETYYRELLQDLEAIKHLLPLDEPQDGATPTASSSAQASKAWEVVEWLEAVRGVDLHLRDSPYPPSPNPCDEPSSSPPPPPPPSPPALQMLTHVSQIQFSLLSSVPRFTFQTLMLLTAEHQASDPRDKLYAFLGLCSSSPSTPSSGPFSGLPIPDYSLPVPEVFTQTTLHFISRDREFSVLHLAGIGFPRAYELPSWVPDYTLSGREMFANGRVTILGRRTKAMYRAWNGVMVDLEPKIRWGITREGSKLGIWGFGVDRVKHVLPSLSGGKGIKRIVDEGTEEEVRMLLRWFGGVRGLVMKGYENLWGEYEVPYRRERISRLKAMVRVLVGGEAYWEGTNPVLPMEEEYWGFLRENQMTFGLVEAYEAFSLLLVRVGLRGAGSVRVMSEQREVDGEPSEHVGSRPKFVSSGGGIDDDLTELTRLQARLFCRVTDELSDRCIFVTESGRIGRGPPLTRVGDKICVFMGARTPFIIRAQSWYSSRWQLVGESYVEGLMANEAQSIRGWRWRYYDLF